MNQQSTTNSLGLLLLDSPFPVVKGLKFYQPTLRDIVIMGEEHYILLIKLWTLSREQLVPTENAYTKSLDDFSIWKEYIMSVEKMKDALEESCLVFFHKKIEFLPISNTIYIGEAENGLLLDLGLFLLIKSLFSKIDPSSGNDKDEQYKETANMSEREKRLIALMKEREAKLNKLKYGEKNNQDLLGKQIVALTAIGNYTFSEVYNMTMLQFTHVLRKYTDIERYELHTMLSPYISSKDKNQETNKHWLAD